MKLIKLPWDYMDRFSKEIKKYSEERRKNPLKFFIRFLEEIWKDNTRDEAIVQWKVKVEHFPWYAMDALYCMNTIIANPPDNLIDILEDHGWIGQYHEINGHIVPFTFEESLEWLKKMYEQFRSIFEARKI